MKALDIYYFDNAEPGNTDSRHCFSLLISTRQTEMTGIVLNLVSSTTHPANPGLLLPKLIFLLWKSDQTRCQAVNDEHSTFGILLRHVL